MEKWAFMIHKEESDMSKNIVLISFTEDYFDDWYQRVTL